VPGPARQRNSPEMRSFSGHAARGERDRQPALEYPSEPLHEPMEGSYRCFEHHLCRTFWPM
jgi:hypothetical protein